MKLRNVWLKRTCASAGPRTPTGGWEDFNGPAYATAMALIILQLPNNYLPIMQK